MQAAGGRLVGRSRWRWSRRSEQRVEQVDDRAAEAGGAVERGLVDFDSGGSVVFDAAEQAGVASSPAAGDPTRRRWPQPRCRSVCRLSQQFAAQPQQRRLADAPGDEHQMVDGRDLETVAQGAPDDQFLADGDVPKRGGEPAVHGVDEVGVAAWRSPALSVCGFKERVVDGKRPGQQRIATMRNSDHGKLPGDRGGGDRRAVEPESPRVVGNLVVGHDPR